MSMSPQLATGITVFLVAQSFVIVGNLIFFLMIARVNRLRPPGEKIGYPFGRPGAYMPVFREFRRLYPRGTLHLWLIVLALIGIGAAVFSFDYFGIIKLF
jgi:hypothetical protein